MSWLAKFDNTHWAEGGVFTWDGSQWSGTPFPSANFYTTGSWQTFTKSQMRVTFSAPVADILIRVYYDGGTFDEFATYSSGDEIEVDDLEIDYLLIQFSGTVTFTNIEFLITGGIPTFVLDTEIQAAHRAYIRLNTEAQKAHRASLRLDPGFQMANRSIMKLDVQVVTTSQIWGYVRDWRGHILRKRATIVASSVDGGTLYGRTQSNPTTGYYELTVPLASGTQVLATAFYEGSYRGQSKMSTGVLISTGIV